MMRPAAAIWTHAARCCHSMSPNPDVPACALIPTCQQRRTGRTCSSPRVPTSVLVLSVLPAEELAGWAHSRVEFLTSLMKLWRDAVCQIILVQSCLYCALLPRYCFSLPCTHTLHISMNSQRTKKKKNPGEFLLFVWCAVTFRKAVISD